MSIDERVAKLEAQMQSLQSAYIQSQRNEIPVRAQIDDLTPWTASKNAYIDNTECIFEGVPTGNISVYVGGVNHTLFERDGDRVVVRFEPLEEVTEVTISII